VECWAVFERRGRVHEHHPDRHEEHGEEQEPAINGAADVWSHAQNTESSSSQHQPFWYSPNTSRNVPQISPTGGFGFYRVEDEGHKVLRGDGLRLEGFQLPANRSLVALFAVLGHLLATPLSRASSMRSNSGLDSFWIVNWLTPTTIC